MPFDSDLVLSGLPAGMGSDGGQAQKMASLRLEARRLEGQLKRYEPVGVEMTSVRQNLANIYSELHRLGGQQQTAAQKPTAAQLWLQHVIPARSQPSQAPPPFDIQSFLAPPSARPTGPSQNMPAPGSPEELSRRLTTPVPDSALSPGTRHYLHVSRNLANLPFDPVEVHSSVAAGRSSVPLKLSAGGGAISLPGAAKALAKAIGLPPERSHALLDVHSPEYGQVREYISNHAPDVADAWTRDSASMDDLDIDARLRGLVVNYGGTGMQSDSPGMTYGRAIGAASPSAILHIIAGDPRPAYEYSPEEQIRGAVGDAGTMMLAGGVTGGLSGGARAAASGALRAGLLDAGEGVAQSAGRIAARRIAGNVAANAVLQAPQIAVRANDIARDEGLGPLGALGKATGEGVAGFFNQYNPTTPFDPSASPGERTNATLAQLLGMLTLKGGVRPGLRTDHGALPAGNPLAGSWSDWLENRSARPAEGGTPPPQGPGRTPSQPIGETHARLLQAIDQEWEKGLTFGNQATVNRVKDFITYLPEHLITEAKLQFEPELTTVVRGERRQASGDYDHFDALIRISRAFSDPEVHPRRIEEALYHEFGHHLQVFIPPESYGRLVEQFKADLRRSGNPDEYRFQSFAEWWSAKITQYEASRRMPTFSSPQTRVAFRQAASQALDKLRQFAEAAAGFWRDRGRPDRAIEMYKTILRTGQTRELSRIRFPS